jgi:hypothetical protein
MSEEIIRERIVEKAPESKKDFSEEYVRQLREEAAGWRVKYREMEQKQKMLEVKAELDKRGIKADPSWIKVADGQSVELAIEGLLRDYPHLKPDPENEMSPEEDDTISKIINKKVEVGKMPKPASPDPASYGHETKSPQEVLKNRQLDEIKKDPKARSLLRKQYRHMLASEGHRPVDFD